jgi:hypothetical protein
MKGDYLIFGKKKGCISVDYYLHRLSYYLNVFFLNTYFLQMWLASGARRVPACSRKHHSTGLVLTDEAAHNQNDLGARSIVLGISMYQQLT